MAQNEPSHLDLHCLTFSLSTLHINFFPSDSLLKKKRRKKQTTNVIGNLALLRHPLFIGYHGIFKNCSVSSANMIWLFYLGKQIVAQGPHVLIFRVKYDFTVHVNCLLDWCLLQY